MPSTLHFAVFRTSFCASARAFVAQKSRYGLEKRLDSVLELQKRF